jgi:hypothetical protein
MNKMKETWGKQVTPLKQVTPFETGITCPFEKVSPVN